MSDKTDYKRLKKNLEDKNLKLSNENYDLRKMVRLATSVMTDEQKKQYLDKIKKESFL